MCVTSAPATLSGPLAFTSVVFDDTPETTHFSGYQIGADNMARGDAGNCVLLHVPGKLIGTVAGPERTRHMMTDMTAGLRPLVEIPVFRGGRRSIGASSAQTRVETYGEYDVVLSSSAIAIPDALSSVSEARRPKVDAKFARLIRWYESNYSDHSFVLACFNGSVNPKHPIVYSYHPNNDDMLHIPGLDAHTGEPPRLGERIARNFRVAFSVQRDVPQPIRVHYQDPLAQSAWWAPDTVAGFWDNRGDAPNADYTASLEDLLNGQSGRFLLEEMVL